MLNNVLSNVKTYVENHKKLEATLIDTKNKIYARYKDAAFLEKFEQVRGIYLEDVDKLYNEFKGKVEDEFNEAEKSIRSLVMIPIHQEMINSMNILEQIKNPTEEEIKSVFEATKNSYLASKKAHDAFKVNDDYSRKVQAFFDGETEVEPLFIPMDFILEEIKNLKMKIMDTIFISSTQEFSNNQYWVANIINGTWIDNVVESANNFYNRYKAE